jgi:hypothetical protein
MATDDPQDVAEALDPDVLPRYDDAEDALTYPPDRFQGANSYGTTEAEERVDEPLDERVAREEPDPLASIDEPDAEVLLEIEAEERDARLFREVSLDGTDASADEREDIGQAVGRLGEPGPDDDTPRDADDEADAVAWAADADDLSAEEDAVHITFDPELGEPGDGYE